RPARWPDPVQRCQRWHLHAGVDARPSVPGRPRWRLPLRCTRLRLPTSAQPRRCPMSLPPKTRKSIRDKVWTLADRADWLTLSDSIRSRKYEEWTRDPEIGGVL